MFLSLLREARKACFFVKLQGRKALKHNHFTDLFVALILLSKPPLPALLHAGDYQLASIKLQPHRPIANISFRVQKVALTEARNVTYSLNGSGNKKFSSVKLRLL